MNSFVTQLLSLGEILIYSSYIAIFTKDPLVPLPREAEELCSTRRPAVFPLKSRPKWTIIAYLQVTRRKFYARILCFSGVAARASRGFLLGTESTWIDPRFSRTTLLPLFPVGGHSCRTADAPTRFDARPHVQKPLHPSIRSS